MKLKNKIVNQNIKEKNTLLLNRINTKISYIKFGNKCICGDYCKDPNSNIGKYNIDIFYSSNHNKKLNKIINNEKKIMKHGNNSLYCIDCNSVINKKSNKTHFKCKLHMKKINKCIKVTN